MDYQENQREQAQKLIDACHGNVILALETLAEQAKIGGCDKSIFEAMQKCVAKFFGW